MKIIKKRERSKLHVGLNYLNKRIKLNDSDKYYLTNLEKGFEGEERFDELVKTNINDEALVVNDLLIESKGRVCQIDALIVTSETIFLYEIKNYKGDFQMNSGQLSYTSGHEIMNPLIQLKRTKELLRQLLKDWKISYKIEANVLFINDAFTLYNASLEDPIIFPTQIKEHFIGLNSKCRDLTKQANYLAEKLIDRHKLDSIYQKQLPYYRFEEMKTGASCSCGSFDLMITQRACYCKKCYKQMSIKELVLESVKELQCLFPEEKLTTALVNEFCGQDIYYQKIRSILQENFTVKGITQGTFYE